MSQTPWFDYALPEAGKNRFVGSGLKKALIVGGGIAGCQIAWHLNRAGWQVELFERRHALASEASGNPAGVISPKLTATPGPGESFYLAAFDYTTAQLELLDAASETTGWNPCGVIQLAHDERETNRIKALGQRSFDKQLVQFLNPRQASRIAGLPLDQGACWFPRGGWIKPRRWCETLTRHPNCQIHTGTEAKSLQQTESGWQLIDLNGQTIATAPLVIFASGYELQHFSQTSPFAGLAVRGQTSVLESDAQTRQLRCVIGHEGYVTPAIEISGIKQPSDAKTHDCHVFGATFERNSTSDVPREIDNRTNLSQLRQFIEPFQNQHFDDKVRTGHAAVRMTTPDRFPYCGGVPDIAYYEKEYADLGHGRHWKNYPPARYLPGLFVLAGFGSRGLTTAPFCASLLAELINTGTGNLPESSRDWLTRLHPARFLIKSLKRGQSIQNQR